MEFSEVLQDLQKRRDRVMNGLWNCIPLPFPRFKQLLPGFEQGKYIVVTANQKVGKSKLCDYLLVYSIIFFAMEHPEFKAKILYFTLEMSPKEKYNEFLCHLLFRLDGIVISPAELKSTDKDKPVDPHIFELLKSERYQAYIRKFEEMVEYIDTDRNPTGINKKCRAYAEEHGHYNYKTVKNKNKLTGEEEEVRILDPTEPYTPDDPEEYKIVIVDNASNISLEKGLDKRESIDKLSKHGITLRNQMQFIFVLIQHQAQAQEGIENQKLNRLKPSSDGLADCKTTTRDANLVIGLYSPFKYGIPDFEGYDIRKFRNYIRFMEVIEDRDYGSAGNICPLFFNGAVSTFNELPLPTDSAGLESVYGYIDNLNKQKMKRKAKSFFMYLRRIFKK